MSPQGQSVLGHDPASWRGRRVAVLGLGVSNVPLVRFLCRQGAVVSARDQKPAEELAERLQELAGWPVEFRLGPGYLDDLRGYDYLFLTPGMRKDLPAIEAARRAGATVTGEAALFLALCRARVTGVTGSAGKTTTTALVGQMYRQAGREVYVGGNIVVGGGNIGSPLIEKVLDIPPQAEVVLELSSFQLQLCDTSPDISLVTNIHPAHLDVHASFEEYAWSKKNIFRYQDQSGWAVFNADDPGTHDWPREAPGQVAMFSSAGDHCTVGAFAREVTAFVRAGVDRAPEPVIRRAEVLLPGQHNWQNLLGAMAAAAVAGVRPWAMYAVARTFVGVEHRLELCGVYRGIRAVNDSIATTPERAIAGLLTLSEPVVLVAGGYDKHISYREWAKTVLHSTVHTVVLVGQTAVQMKEEIEAAKDAEGVPGPAVMLAKDFPEAVALAMSHARPGDTVLLSPAAASYDLFHNFGERGQLFKDLVRQWGDGR